MKIITLQEISFANYNSYIKTKTNEESYLSEQKRFNDYFNSIEKPQKTLFWIFSKSYSKKFEEYLNKRSDVLNEWEIYNKSISDVYRNEYIQITKDYLWLVTQSANITCYKLTDITNDGIPIISIYIDKDWHYVRISHDDLKKLITD